MTTAAQQSTQTATTPTEAKIYKIAEVQGWERDYYANKRPEVVSKLLQDLGLGDRIKALQATDAYKAANAEEQTKLLIADFKDALQKDSRFSGILQREAALKPPSPTPLTNFVNGTGTIDDNFIKACQKISTNLASFGNNEATKSLEDVRQHLANEKNYATAVAAYNTLSRMFPEAATKLDATGGLNTEQRVDSLLKNFQDHVKTVPETVANHIGYGDRAKFLAQNPPKLDAAALNCIRAFVNLNSGSGGFLAGEAASIASNINAIAEQQVPRAPSTTQQQTWERNYYSERKEKGLENVYASLGQSERLKALQSTDAFKNASSEARLGLIVDDFARYAGATAFANMRPSSLSMFLDENKTTPGQFNDKFLAAVDMFVSHKRISGDKKPAELMAVLRDDIRQERDYNGQQSGLRALSILFPNAADKLEGSSATSNTLDKVKFLLGTLQTTLKNAPAAEQAQYSEFLKANPPLLDTTSVKAISAYFTNLAKQNDPRAQGQADAFLRDLNSMLNTRS